APNWSEPPAPTRLRPGGRDGTASLASREPPDPDPQKVTVKRTILAVAAGLLTVLALSMFATRPTTTFSTGLEGGDVVVSCHPVSVIDDSSRPLDGLGSRRYTYRIEEGR